MASNGVGATTAASDPTAVAPSGASAKPTENDRSNGSNVSRQRIQSLIGRAANLGEIQYIGQPQIIADERTNSLLIYATPQDMRKMGEIISRLDHTLTQLLIEVVTSEMSPCPCTAIVPHVRTPRGFLTADYTDYTDFFYPWHPRNPWLIRSLVAALPRCDLHRKAFAGGAASSIVSPR